MPLRYVTLKPPFKYQVTCIFTAVIVKMQMKTHQHLQSTGKILLTSVRNRIDDEYERSFLCAVKPVIYLSQLFGLFPISGLNSKDPKSIKFKWISLRTFFSLSFVSASILVTFLSVYRQTQSGPLSPSNIVGIIFYFNCTAICILFFKISMRFSEIMERWMKVEKSLSKLRFIESSTEKRSLKIRVNTCAMVLLILAAFEHLGSIASQVQRVLHQIEVCNWTRHDSFDKEFVTSHLYVIFSMINFNYFNGFLAEYLNVSLTFYWTFVDVFIMVISIGISFNYDNINRRLNFFKNQVLPDVVWAEIRENYNEVSDFLKFIDGAMEKITVLACCNDSYFIIIQLLNLTTYHAYVIDEIYFYYSLAFLMLRTCAMFLIASSIFEKSRKPLKILRSIPNEGWRQEIERLSNQVATECNALSGMNFFYMTKKTLLGLAGTIVTYELVMLQFDTTEADKSAWINCSG